MIITAFIIKVMDKKIRRGIFEALKKRIKTFIYAGGKLETQPVNKRHSSLNPNPGDAA